MRLIIDTDAELLIEEDATARRELPLHSPEAFAAISAQWVKVGWSQKYSYGFTWLGRPLIQLPEDVLRIQEVIFQTAPNVIVETGIAHGGSLVFYASLCKAMGRGRVIGVDIDIRPHNRAAIEGHSLSNLITLIEGSSTDPATIDRVRQLIKPEERVLVLLDSNHSRAHVLAELKAYGALVSVGSYIVAMDGIMAEVASVPGGRPEWTTDNPRAAAREFAASSPHFELSEPQPLFNEGKIRDRVTYCPGAYLRRIA